MNQVKTSFGFDTIAVGSSLIVHTCKVRLKIDKLPKLPNDVKVTPFTGGIKQISFEVLDGKRAELLSKKIGVICKNHAQNKLNQKYQWVS